MRDAREEFPMRRECMREDRGEREGIKKYRIPLPLVNSTRY